MLLDMMVLFFACFPTINGENESKSTEQHVRPDNPRTSGIIFGIIVHWISMAR